MCRNHVHEGFNIPSYAGANQTLVCTAAHPDGLVRGRGEYRVCVAYTEDSEERLWMFTLLSWAAFPSSFIVTPLANRVVMALDVTNIKVIDLVVAATVVASGYVQWFVFPAVISVRKKGNR